MLVPAVLQWAPIPDLTYSLRNGYRNSFNFKQLSIQSLRNFRGIIIILTFIYSTHFHLQTLYLKASCADLRNTSASDYLSGQITCIAAVAPYTRLELKTEQTYSRQHRNVYEWVVGGIQLKVLSKVKGCSAIRSHSQSLLLLEVLA